MYNCLLLILLNVVYFVCNRYPKHIIELGSIYSVFSIIFNLAFYIILALLIVVSFSNNKMLFSGSLSSSFGGQKKNNQIKEIGFILIYQILIDVLLLILREKLNVNIYFFIDFTTAIQWVIFYIICVDKEKNIFIQRSAIPVLGVLLFLVGISFAVDFSMIEKSKLLFQKYDSNSQLYNTSIRNLQFMFEVKNCILDTVSGLLLFIVHFVCNKIRDNKKQNKLPEKIVRIIALLMLAFVLILAKTFLLPYSCLSGYRVGDSRTTIAQKEFYANTKTITITRRGVDGSNTVAFQITKNELLYDGKSLLQYVSNGNRKANSMAMNGNTIVMNGPFEKVNYNGVEFYLYQNQVICYFYKNSPVVVLPGDTASMNDGHLCDIYRALIENGNWNLYEEATKYLVDCDSDFIIPYIERHMVGQFNEKEIDMLKKTQIKPVYIQQIAKCRQEQL